AGQAAGSAHPARQPADLYGRQGRCGRVDQRSATESRASERLGGAAQAGVRARERRSLGGTALRERGMNPMNAQALEATRQGAASVDAGDLAALLQKEFKPK